MVEDDCFAGRIETTSIPHIILFQLNDIFIDTTYQLTILLLCLLPPLSFENEFLLLFGTHCANNGKSALITVPILEYPPVVGQSAIITIGCPLAGTCIEPKVMPSEISSVLLR